MQSVSPDPDRRRRVLWLLNHKTLMQAELPVLLGLGYEVLTPKIIPTKNFRSGAVDFESDRSLTLPAGELALLNAFDFYSREWPAEVEAVINARFAVVFVRPSSKMELAECLRRFRGHVALRGFGNPNGECYARWLARAGEGAVEAAAALGPRFSLAAGYAQLAEAEPPLLARRTVHLPIGLPESFFARAGTWNGRRRAFLTVLPDVGVGGWEAATYAQLKSEMGHLPHVIAGAQSVPVADPAVVGFVPEADLLALYRDCVAYFSPSRQRRHLLYSPVEAAAAGQPVVCLAESLAGRLIGPDSPGVVRTVAEAARVLGRLLAGEPGLAQRIVAAQRGFLDGFSAETCRRAYAPVLAEMVASAGDGNAGPPSPAAVPPADVLALLPEEAGEPARPSEWIDFGSPVWPASVRGVFGISVAEGWGRWSEYERAQIALAEPLPARARVLLIGGAERRFWGAPITARAGGSAATFAFSNFPGGRTGVAIDLEPAPGTTLLEFEFAGLPRRSADRRIALAFERMCVLDRDAPDCESRTAEALDAFEVPAARPGPATPGDTVELAAPEWTAAVTGFAGFGPPEPWGRWVTAERARLRYAAPLPPRCRVLLSGGGGAVTIRAGGAEARARLDAPAWEPGTAVVELEPGGETGILEIVPADGLALSAVRVVDRAAPWTDAALAAFTRFAPAPAGGVDALDLRDAGRGGPAAGLAGFDPSEGWGRWTRGEWAHVRFARPLPRRARLVLFAGTDAPGRFVASAGGSEAAFALGAPPWEPRAVVLDLDAAGSDLLTLRAPDTRLGLCWLRAFDRDAPGGEDLAAEFAALPPPPPEGASGESAVGAVGLRLGEGPGLLVASAGLHAAEPWGRWTAGGRVLLRLAGPLPARARVTLTGGADARNAGRPVTIRAGRSAAPVAFAAPPWEPEDVSADLSPEPGTRVLEVVVPEPAPDAEGAVGLGLGGVRIVDLDAA